MISIQKEYDNGRRNFIRVDLYNKYLRGVNLRGANLQGANISYADLTGANLQGANLKRAKLRCITLVNAYLRGTDLSRSDLSHSKLKDIDLYGANLEDANLNGADLSGADLENANLEYANLRCVDLRGANLKGANIQPIWDDLREVVIPNIRELPYLYKQLLAGNIDGSTYDGDCACLSGTLAHGEEYTLPQSIMYTRDASRPIEGFFFRIKPGDNPSNSWDVQQVIKQLETIAKEFNIPL